MYVLIEKRRRKTQKQTAVSEANVSEKIRCHRNPFRNHSHFLEEDIKKKKPQLKVQRELKEKPRKPDSPTTPPCSPWAGEAELRVLTSKGSDCRAAEQEAKPLSAARLSRQTRLAACTTPTIAHAYSGPCTSYPCHARPGTPAPDRQEQVPPAPRVQVDASGHIGECYVTYDPGLTGQRPSRVPSLGRDTEHTKGAAR